MLLSLNGCNVLVFAYLHQKVQWLVFTACQFCSHWSVVQEDVNNDYNVQWHEIILTSHGILLDLDFMACPLQILIFICLCINLYVYIYYFVFILIRWFITRCHCWTISRLLIIHWLESDNAKLIWLNDAHIGMWFDLGQDFNDILFIYLSNFWKAESIQSNWRDSS